jgi:hypothetical protein
MSQLKSHRNQLSIRYVDEASQVRVVDAFVNASAALEEADVRLPLEHPSAKRDGWWNASQARGLMLAFERAFLPPAAASESLFVASRRSAAHVVCVRQDAAGADKQGEEKENEEGVQMTNESVVTLLARDKCRRALRAGASFFSLSLSLARSLSYINMLTQECCQRMSR